MIKILEKIVEERQCQEHTFTDGEELLIDLNSANVLLTVYNSLTSLVAKENFEKRMETKSGFLSLTAKCWGWVK